MKTNILKKIEYIIETFKELGNLSGDKLKKGQRLYRSDKDNFTKVNGRVFYNAITKIKENDINKLNKGLPYKGLNTLSVYGVSEYKKMKCFLGKNNSSGYAIAHGNELVSVFSSQKSSADAIMVSAVNNGVKYLDCYAQRNPKTKKISGPLYNLYLKYGFKINTSLNTGKKGDPYSIVDGVSDYVDDKGKVQKDDLRVVVFMIK